MNVPLELTPVTEMQCVLILKAVSLVPVTLASLVMAYCAVSKKTKEKSTQLFKNINTFNIVIINIAHSMQ